LEIIEDMGISQAEFATRMGTTAKTLSTLINGQINLSNDLAKKLSAMLGTSVDIWLNIQKGYDQRLIEIQTLKDLDSQIDIVKQIDYKYFETVAGLPKVKSNYDKIGNLCQYLTVSNLNILLQPDFMLNYRTGIPNFDTKNIINSKAWIQTAINYSKDIKTDPFNAAKLKEHLPELRNMTVQKPEDFLPRMKEIFSKCGVAFVLLPHLKNSGVNGAVKWVSSDRVVLAMNNRGLYADKFWFSLFHEIKHVLQQKVTKMFISGSEVDLVEYNKELEEEADTFAKNYLIPASALKKFAPGKYTSDEEIIAFANSIGIHPGIVAGRLQHDKILPPSRCASLKEKYVIELTV
jgi:addiction module HigA family antidote